jgi:hypothetical protein
MRRRTKPAEFSPKAVRTDAADGYVVGYRRPPAATRFKPGKSGNPKGRRKGSKNFKTLIKEALHAKITIQEGSTSRRVSKFEGVILRQLQNALKGSDRSAMALFKMAAELDFLEDAQNNTVEGESLTPADEAILELLLPLNSRRRQRPRK